VGADTFLPGQIKPRIGADDIVVWLYGYGLLDCALNIAADNYASIHGITSLPL
jgi:hypothetical protein